MLIKQLFRFSSSQFTTRQHTIPGVIVAELNNPTKKNALSKQLIQDIRTQLTEIAASNAIHCVILKSAVPEVFCAGADLKERVGISNFDTEVLVKNLRDTFNMVANLPQPVIAVIDGYALGGGLELALAADMRIITSKSVLGLPETQLAIIPGAGGTQRTPRLIGNALAKELILTGRRIDAAEALRIGLVNYVTNDAELAMTKAEELAKLITNAGPIAIRAAKAAINRGSEVDIESGLKIEEMLYYQVCNSKDRVEGLLAFKEKRKPQYKGE